MTIDRETHALTPNFTVFATQNPIEYEGTYPLPEAQKDRFLLKIPMSAPEREDELELARRMLGCERAGGSAEARGRARSAAAGRPRKGSRRIRRCFDAR